MKKKKKEEKRDVLLVKCFLQQLGRKKTFTAANYQNVMQSVLRFLGDEAERFQVGDISRDWVLQYISYLEETRGLSAGSVDLYLRVLRAVYNRAVWEGLIIETEGSPFQGVHIVVPPTLKRTLSVEEMSKLQSVDLSHKKCWIFVRDLFLFLFYARGMCFVDVFSLKYSQISGGYIRYIRSKTDAPLNVKIVADMQVILNRYREEGNPYLFPSLRRNCYKKEQVVSEPTSCRRINRQLNALGEMLGFNQPLTVYVARHTWASFAEASGMSITFISQGLGHSSERVTRIYMKGIPSSQMDEANQEMLNKMLWGDKTEEKTEKKIEKKIEAIDEKAEAIDEKEEEIDEKEETCLTLCKNETSVFSTSLNT